MGTLRPVDRMIAGYGIFVAIVAATRLELPGVWLVLLGHLLLPVLAVLGSRASDSTTGRFLRAYYPVILLTALYSSLDVLNRFGTAVVWDPPLLQLEQAVFGSQPARDWWRASPSTFWSTVLHAVYFSYYIIVPLPLLVFAALRRRAASDQYLVGIIATFLICYAIYLLFPVAGPYYEFARPTGEFIANGPARLVYATLERGSAYGAAFPSSHVAATVAATVGAWRGSRTLGMTLAIPTALLAVGVVYCQMHYVIDSVAGVVVGAAIPLLVGRTGLQSTVDSDA